MLRKFIIVAIVAIAALAIGGTGFAQDKMAPTTQGGIKRTPLQRFDVPVGDREVVTVIAEVPPNGEIARHTHPGPEVDYILEGDVTLTIGSDAAKTYKAGASFVIPQAVPHGGHAGPNGSKVLATYIVEKGKPLASPAP
jgi:quercetin dioxygenase-like cupin family protein